MVERHGAQLPPVSAHGHMETHRTGPGTLSHTMAHMGMPAYIPNYTLTPHSHSPPQLDIPVPQAYSVTHSHLLPQTLTVTQPSTQSPIIAPHSNVCIHVYSQARSLRKAQSHQHIQTSPFPSLTHTHFSETFSDADAYFQLHYHPPGVACTHAT